MTRREKTGSDASMVFVVYAVGAVFAAAPALATDPLLADGNLLPGLSAELVRARLPTSGTTLGITAAAAAFATALLGPWLSMAWLAALARTLSLRAALLAGIRLYVPALVLGLTLAVPTLLLVALTLLAPYGVHLALEEQPDMRLHDLAVLLSSAPALAVVLGAATFYDLARAALAAGTPDPLRHAMNRLDLAAVLRYLLYAGTGAALGGTAVAAAAAIGTTTTPAAALALLSGQILALLRVACRARWLEHAVEQVAGNRGNRVRPESGSPAPRAAGSTPPTR